MKPTKKNSKIFFDLVLINDDTSKQFFISSFSIDESELPEVSVSAIINYIVNNFDKFSTSKKFKCIDNQSYGFNVPHIILLDGKTLNVVNVRKI